MEKWSASEIITTEKLAAAPPPSSPEVDDEFAQVGSKVFALIHRLKMCDAPTVLWSAVRLMQGSTMTSGEVQIHVAFSFAMIDIAAAVGHTGGAERHGKGYKRIHSPHRTKMLEAKLGKAIFVANNYDLIHSSPMPMLNVTDFAHGFLSHDELELLAAAEALEEERTLLEGGAASPLASQVGDDEDSSDVDSSPQEDETFSVPPGFLVQLRPDALDSSLVGKFIYSAFRMENGRRGQAKREWTEWYLGRIIRHFDASNAPSMHKRYNYDVQYDGEGKRGVMLSIADYKSDAGDVGLKPGTWVLLAAKP